ncbi:T9SS type B sorting domain-containing protein [Hanstruepera ponticola]|uniref:T9SS type B sorting domain-containing protein n=1 Tax=Hanstruepera ponticola TaxID=2042995 RepID=UPI0017869AA8|nr:T9SS type B sorting domain-containing protein [Hanstruepera ponticola]
MYKVNTYTFIFLSLILLLSGNFGYAQLSFCSGNSGDPIYFDDFGSGTTNGPALPSGTTSYTYANSEPEDGFYTISSNTNWFGWHNTQDHTPGDTNGRSLIVNADFTAGEFYRTTISGLCDNTTYEFSSWLLNLLPPGGFCGTGIPINVKFQIWDNTDTVLLASGDTGDIQGTTTPVWEEYGLVFTTTAGQSSIILKMLNNGVGGCGNDLAIDDIVFKTCGDFISIADSSSNSSVSLCTYDLPYNTLLEATPDFSVYDTHFYQWQQSNDGINWFDISGETNQTLQINNLTTTTHYRVKMAETQANLLNESCNTISEEFEIIVFPEVSPPTSDGDVNLNCSTGVLSVTVPNGIQVDWYNAPTGGQLLESNSLNFSPNILGVYYAEAIDSNSNCSSTTRTAVTLLFGEEIPVIEDEYLTFCEGESIILEAGLMDMDYLWNTGETTSQITVSTPGIYTVEVTNSSNCSAIKTIELLQIDAPVIEAINSNGYQIEIHVSSNGNYLFSLDGTNFQLSNIFEIEGGNYTVFVKAEGDCGIVSENYIHFVIPKFFTPNNDGQNDTFNLKGIESFSESEVYIFDRYGKLIKSALNQPFSWDGTYRNEVLQTSDFWYYIRIENQIFKGHFTLKR